MRPEASEEDYAAAASAAFSAREPITCARRHAEHTPSGPNRLPPRPQTPGRRP